MISTSTTTWTYEVIDLNPGDVIRVRYPQGEGQDIEGIFLVVEITIVITNVCHVMAGVTVIVQDSIRGALPAPGSTWFFSQSDLLAHAEKIEWNAPLIQTSGSSASKKQAQLPMTVGVHCVRCHVSCGSVSGDEKIFAAMSPEEIAKELLPDGLCAKCRGKPDPFEGMRLGAKHFSPGSGSN